MTPAVDALATGDARTWSAAKPRMVFFRINDADLPEFINGHFRDHVRCLEQFFNVHLISDNADYDEAVDRLRPDIALFESGVYARAGRRIVNTHTHPEIPKVGLLDADAYCLTRSVFLSDMEDWGVETFFAIAVSAVGYTPDIADSTYVWPNFADKSIFRTYPGGNPQSVLLSGSRESNYPWRVKVDRLLREHFPVRVLQHAGWFKRDAASGMPSGEEYARSLSAAQIVPTCGTIAEDLVRKHFEIPAAGSLLLTERTLAVETAGFVDMENCVFADESDVVDKVEFLLANPDTLERIARAGQELAHTRHSIEHRDQIRQWYELNRGRAAGQRIVQPELFGALVVEGAAETGAPVSIVTPPGVDRRLVGEGRRLLAAGDLGAAADRFAQVLNLHFEPEAALGLARSWVRLGRPGWARKVLEYSTTVVVKPHGASHPDPVEWAWLIRVALCEGDLARARELAGQYARLRHPELDRMRAVIGHLANDPLPVSDRPHRRSVHSGFGADTWVNWIGEFERDLDECGRGEFARRVAAAPAHRVAPTASGRPKTAVAVRKFGASARRLPARVARRLGRDWARLRGRDTTPDRSSVFQLLAGRDIDSVVALMVDGDTGDRLESLVNRDPSSLSLVRVGRTLPVVDAEAFAPWGLRWGLDTALLRQLPAWGRSMVVTSPIGAGMLRIEQLERTEVLVVIGEGTTALAQRQIASDPAWRAASDDRTSRVATALAQPQASVWERVQTHSGPTSAQPQAEETVHDG